MYITEIHIYGYGKLTDFKITGLNELQVLYGENEAGKSTILSFIHSILFGFPTKQQSELRYEPKEGSKYGGKLTVFFQERGRAVIERVKGKAAGDVKVVLENGITGGEELLSDLLQNVDKSLFQSIFSFNIHGLQNVNGIKSEDLGRFLFSAGALGTDQLMTAENALQKEMEARFKPNGKKPSINEKLKKLKQLHLDLQKAEQKNEQYWSLLQQRDELEKKIAEQHNELQLMENRHSRLGEWKRLLPLLTEEKILKEEAAQYGDIPFPADGIARFNRIEAMKKPLESRLAGLEAHLKNISAEMADNVPDDSLLEKESEITAMIESLPILEKLKQEENELTIKLSEIEQKETIQREKLHLPIDDERLLQIDTSVFMKEKIINAHEEQKRIMAKRLDLDERFNEEKQALEELEDEIKNLETEVLPSSEREELKRKVQNAENKHHLEQELIDTRERLKFLQKAKEREKAKADKAAANNRVQLLLFTILFASLFAWGAWNGNWMLAGAGLIGIAFSFYSFPTKKAAVPDDIIEEEMEALIEKEMALQEKINYPDLQHISIIENQLQRDRQISEQLSHYKIKWEQRNGQYEKVLQAFEKWEKNAMDHEGKLIEYGKKMSLSPEMALAHLLDAFHLIEQLKTLLREKKFIKERLEAVSEGLNKIVNEFTRFGSLFLGENPSIPAEAAYLLRKRLKEETEKQIIQSEKKGKLKELEEEHKKAVIELNHYETELEALLAVAKTESAEEFLEIGQKAQKKAHLDEQINEIQRQIKISGFKETEFDAFGEISNPELELRRTADRLDELRDSYPVWQSRLAEIKYETNLLEEGGTYAELLHTYKLKKSELEDEAREWSRFALAKDLLGRTIERFKEERMPSMLECAEEFLSCLTDGMYVRIRPKKEGSGFLIESRNAAVFEANELSQATAEQIYVSLRLALAETVYKKYHFPIIIDDSFVNFDHKRTEKIFNLLKNLTGRQILFFTCHKHLLPSFSDEQIVSVNKVKGVLEMNI